MNENTNPEIIPEEQPEAVGEPEEIVENTAEAVEETAQTAEETVEEAVEEAVEETENAVEETVEPVPAETAGEIAEEAAEQPKKKKRLIQIPVIISLCLVVAVLLSYFVFTAFFLREPEGVTWTTEFEGVPYYFEFDRDGVFKGYVGSVEIESTYAKAKNEDNQNTLTVNTTVCNFYSGYPATYTVTGSRILGNQTLNFSYGEGYDYTLTQSKREKVKRAPDPEFRRKLVIALVIVAAILIMLYRPTRDLYIAWRTGYVLQQRYDTLADENQELSEEVDRLMTREGIEDAARKRGYVMPGETSVKVEGLEGEPAEEPEDEEAESELPWFIHVGDFVFFYKEDA